MNKQEKTVEWQCQIKTQKTHYQAVETAIKSIHPYTLPEIILIPIEQSSKAYEQWVTTP